MIEIISDGSLLGLTCSDASTIIFYVVRMFITLSHVIMKWLPGTVLITFTERSFAVFIGGLDLLGNLILDPEFSDRDGIEMASRC